MWVDQDLTPNRIRQRLLEVSQTPPHDPFPPGFFTRPARPAAVLIPLFRAQGCWNLLFIRRTEAVNDRHAGQVAFPGGRADEPGETAVETALREASEEVGISPEDVEILGSLNAFHTISNYLVTPVVGLLDWPTPLRLAPLEVARAFEIPVPWLAESANHQILYPLVPGFSVPQEVVYYRHYSGELLWGISARIVLNFIQLFGNQMD